LFSIALLDKLVDKQEYLRNNIHKCFDLKRFDSFILFIRHVSPLGGGMARSGGDGRKLVFMLVPSQHALDTFVSAVNRKPEQLFQAKVFFAGQQVSEH
jgi:hypothetical protein